MKRRTPLVAKTPLERRTPLRQVSLKRQAAQAGTSKAKRPKDTGPDRNTRDLVKVREDWHCAVCGRAIFESADWSIHHRRNRGSGGSSDPAINRPSNLLLVCGSGTTLCHGSLTDNEQRGVALEAGWVISTNSGVDPATTPVTHALYGRVLLLDDGEIEPLMEWACGL